MAQRNPDFATLSMEAAKKMIGHFERCEYTVRGCSICQSLVLDFRTKRDAALKAIRKESKGGKRG